MDHLLLLYTEYRPSALLFHTDSEQDRAGPVMHTYKKYFDFWKSKYWPFCQVFLRIKINHCVQLAYSMTKYSTTALLHCPPITFFKHTITNVSITFCNAHSHISVLLLLCSSLQIVFRTPHQTADINSLAFSKHARSLMKKSIWKIKYTALINVIWGF